ncbi:MAG: hypothetical protein ABWZ02_02050 [Nakamurella sp.]
MPRSAVIILTGPARAVKISDDSGRCNCTIPGLQAIPLIDGGAALYVVDGEHAQIRYDVVAGDGTVGAPGQYRWGFRTPGFVALVTAAATARPDQLAAEHLGTCRRAVSIALPPDAPPKAFQLQLVGLPNAGHPLRTVTRQFQLDDLPIEPSQRLSARLDDGGRELHLTNHGPTTTALLTTGSCGNSGSTACSVTIEAGMTTVLRPTSWPSPGAIRFEVRDTPTSPAHRWGRLTA